MRDVLRTFLQIASGVADATREKAVAAASDLVERSGVDAKQVSNQVQQVADELFTSGKENRDLLVGIVRAEVEKLTGKAAVGLRPWADEMLRLTEEVGRLERRVADLERKAVVPATPVTAATAATPAKKAAPAKKAPAARKTATPATPATPAAAKKAPAKKVPAAAAKKTAAAAEKPVQKPVQE